jgi:hypothetical protein
MKKTLKDKCYELIKKTYKVFPSARASQSIAKCRKEKGIVIKSQKGKDLKRWESENWIDTLTGKPCGAGGKKEYCRPTKKISSKTPKTISEISKSKLIEKKKEKIKIGMGKKVSKI